MKKLTLMLTLALAFAAVGAFAGTVSVSAAYFGGTNIMVSPPAQDFSLNWGQIPERTATNTVSAGELRRQGPVIIIAANSGTTATGMTTRTWYVTNGTTVVTNTLTSATPVTVPSSGATAIDGSVYWHRVPASRKGLLLTVLIGGTATDGVVTLTDAEGGTAVVSAVGRTVLNSVDLPNFDKAIYATKSCTNTVTVYSMDVK